MSASPDPATAPPVGRLAPSPTGLLHLGHARSFLFAWWSARSRGGSIRLRIEDLDAARAKPDLVDTAVRDLEWLGLDWDGPALTQSSDPAPYDAALERLLHDGAAYACVCTRNEVRAASAPHAADGELRYPGTCRGRYDSPAAARAASGRESGVRFRVPAGEVAVQDALHGALATDVDADCGDFLLARRDGVVAYQLAVVVDDARQGVTEVVRGDDLLDSAARQVLLQRALSLPTPRYAHVPLVLGEDGERLSKRERSFALAELRAEGVDPRAVVAWAARSSGHALEGLATAAESLHGFALERVARDAAVFGSRELAEVRRWRV